MSALSSLINLFKGSASTKPDYIKGKDGKFAGSRPGVGSIPTSGFDTLIGVRLVDPIKTPDYWNTSSAPEAGSKEKFTAAFDAVMSLGKGTTFSKEFRSDMELRVTSAKYAESDEGQLEVLNKAKELIDLGKLEHANILIEGAKIGREKSASLASPDDVWVVNKVIRQMSKTHFDYIDDAIEEFIAGSKEKVMIAPSGDTPAKELPYNSKRVAEALSIIAGTISAASYADDSGETVKRASVFSPELISEAKKYDGTTFIASDPKDKTYLHSDYYNFVRKVIEEEKNNKELLRHRVERAIRCTEGVIYNKSKGSDKLW